MRTDSFLFRCEQCGEYSVDTKTFERFLTATIKERMNTRQHAGNHTFVLDFHRACPRCSPKDKTTATLKVKKQ